MTILEARTSARDSRQFEAGPRPSAAPEVWPLPRDVVVRRRRVQSRRPGGARWATAAPGC